MCGLAARKISEYLNGTLPPDEHHRIEKHLAACDRCRRQAEEMRRTLFLVQGLERSRPPDDFKVNLYRKLAAAQDSARLPLWRRLLSFGQFRLTWRPAAAAMLLALAVLTLWLAVPHNAPVAEDSDFIRLCLEDHAAFVADHPLADRSALLLGIASSDSSGTTD